MAKALSRLRSLCKTPPADLIEHFEALDGEGHPALLDLPAAVAISREFREFHPLASALGLVFLDDENTSNHHAYITTGPLCRFDSVLEPRRHDASGLCFSGRLSRCGAGGRRPRRPWKICIPRNS